MMSAHDEELCCNWKTSHVCGSDTAEEHHYATPDRFTVGLPLLCLVRDDQ